jgi:predicted small lipoprotein YifL
MRKFGKALLASALILSLAACGGGGENTSVADTDESSSVIQNTENKAITVGNSYSTSNDLEISIFKIITSDKLQVVKGDGSYFEADSGTNYVDVVLNVTNNGSEDLSPNDDITAYFISSDGIQYDDVLIAVETSDDRIDQWGTVNPLSTKKVHIGYKLPTNLQTGKGYIQFGNELFSIEYDASVEISSKISISMNQEIEVEDVASFKILETNYTADVLPPKTSGLYTHYSIDDPSNDIYFVVYCDLTNISTSNIDADDMISMKAIFDGKYQYDANMALEKKDGTGFDYANITSITPLETRKGVFMFEVPKNVQDMSFELSIYFYGNEYSCTK